MGVNFLANKCMVSDKASEAGNVKGLSELDAGSGLKLIIRLQEGA
jgi:hypothetical protein